ncbi:MAG TPA: hypothetical protein VF105_13015 [Gemmatimonadaceae bacterium]
MIRRAGHEIRNALSGVAVNLEVVRSRCSRDPISGEVVSFADRARLQIAEATVLTNGLLALVSAAVAGRNDAKATSARDGGISAEFALNPDASAVMSDIQQLASAIGITVEQRGSNVILQVLPEGYSHSKD